ncbi:MAG: GNAT family N-acetyltransferase [Puia sp.]|nr:GNAT family N-acetyltransferase [Puia sp.]
MSRNIGIETPRTLIREIQLADAEGMFDMDSDPEVKRFLGKKLVTTIGESRDLIGFIRQQYADTGVGRWAIEDRLATGFVGWVGFRLMKETINGHTGYYDFGYRLRRKYWGRGYGIEAARAALNFGIQVMDMDPKKIFAMTDIDNLGSCRILEKIGFAYTGNFPYDGEPTWRDPGQPTAWFELVRK